MKKYSGRVPTVAIFKVSVISPWLFLASTFFFAAIYPGRYDELAQPFSQLGAANAQSGAPNLVGRWIFAGIVLLMAINLFLFWLASYSMRYQFPSSVTLIRYATIVGLASSPFLVMVAVFPTGATLDADVTLTILLHDIGAVMFFLLFSSAIVIYSLVLFQNNQLVIASIGILVFAEALYYILVIIGTTHPLYGLFQKIAIYGFIVWISLISYFLLSHSSDVTAGQLQDNN